MPENWRRNVADWHLITARVLRRRQVCLQCRACGYRRFETALAVERLKYTPLCTRCGKPVEIVR